MVRRATIAVLLLFAVLSLVLTYPLALHLADAVEDRQDALLNVWIMAWDGHQVLSDPLHLFDANIFHPYPRTLAYSELLLGNGLLALPLTAASGNPVLGYNVALLLSFVLSGFGTYLLVRKLTRSPAAGWVSGLIFAFSSYRMTNLAQAQLLTTQWLPFALLGLILLMEHPRPRYVATFVIFFCLQALSSFYYAILLALTVVGLVLWEWVAGEHGMSRLGVPGWFRAQRRANLALLVAAACCTLGILPFALPYFQVQRDLGFERSLADSEPFSASLRQYVMVPPQSVVHGQWLPSDDAPIAGGYPVDALFPGIVALVLSAWGLIRGRGRIRWFFLTLLLVSFLLSLGPRLYLAPGQPAGLGVALPYAWLYAIVPGFKALRAPVRFDVLVMLSLSVLAGLGVAALVRRGDGRSSSLAPASWLLLLTTLVVAGSLVWPAAQAEQVAVGDEVPPVYRWLAKNQPEPVLELPMAFTPGGPRLEYQYFSTYHWRTTPDGYSGFIPPKHGQIVYEMDRFPSERSISLLQALGVRSVVLHADRYPASRWAEMEAFLLSTDGLGLRETFDTDQVYEVQPRTFDAGDLVVNGYLSAGAIAGQPYTAYVIANNTGPRSYAVPPTEELQPTVIWQTGDSGESTGTDGVSGAIPLVTSPDGGAAVVALSMPAPASPGSYELTISEQDGALGSWTLRGTVEVGALDSERASEGVDDSFPVPARLESWDLPAQVRAGESLPVGLTWRALGKIDAYYSVYVKLLDGEGRAVSAWDGQPRDGEAPTLLWVPGERVDDVITLPIPVETAPGEYTVEVGMYRAEDLARCLTLDEDGLPVDRVVLGAVQVQP
jgi:hypothetical protein